MKIKLHFHKSLRKYTNGLSEHEIEAANMSNVISALINLFPKLNYYLTELRYTKVTQDICIIDKEKNPITQHDLVVDRLKKKLHSVLYIVPVLYGSGKGFGKFLLILVVIVVIVLLAVYILPAFAATTAATTAGAAATTGAATAPGFFAGIFTPKFFFGQLISLVISIAIQALNKPRTQKVTFVDGGQRRNNDRFESFINTTSSGQSVPIHYGQTRVAGQLISGFVETTEHGNTDDIKVSESFS